jgi:hypothetical protein
MVPMTAPTDGTTTLPSVPVIDCQNNAEDIDLSEELGCRAAGRKVGLPAAL